MSKRSPRLLLIIPLLLSVTLVQGISPIPDSPNGGTVKSRRVFTALPIDPISPFFIKLNPFSGKIPGVIFGPFSPRIRQNQSYDYIQELLDPVGMLPSEVRTTLLNDWRAIENARGSLLAQAVAADKEDGILYRDGMTRENERSLLQKRIDKANAEIGDYNKQCIYKPKRQPHINEKRDDSVFYNKQPPPPLEDPGCRARRDRLMALKVEFNANIDKDNERSRVWNDRYDAIYAKGDSCVKRMDAWEALLRDLNQKAYKSLEDAGVTAVDFKAQGQDVRKEKVVKVRQRSPLCDAAGLRALADLEQILSVNELRQRDEALKDARAWMMNRPVEGWSPLKTFQNRSRQTPDARISITVIVGRAFIECPGGTKDLK